MLGLPEILSGKVEMVESCVQSEGGDESLPPPCTQCAYQEFPGSETVTLAVTWAKQEVHSTQHGTAKKGDAAASSKACTCGKCMSVRTAKIGLKLEARKLRPGAEKVASMALSHPYLVRMGPSSDKGPSPTCTIGRVYYNLGFTLKYISSKSGHSSACTAVSLWHSVSEQHIFVRNSSEGMLGFTLKFF
eukprot:1160970-Pelagomonas_calceolata.AAC.4